MFEVLALFVNLFIGFFHFDVDDWRLDAREWRRVANFFQKFTWKLWQVEGIKFGACCVAIFFFFLKEKKSTRRQFHAATSCKVNRRFRSLDDISGAGKGRVQDGHR